MTLALCAPLWCPIAAYEIAEACGQGGSELANLGLVLWGALGFFVGVALAIGMFAYATSRSGRAR